MADVVVAMPDDLQCLVYPPRPVVNMPVAQLRKGSHFAYLPLRPGRKRTIVE
jgi:hypothetical protein